MKNLRFVFIGFLMFIASAPIELGLNCVWLSCPLFYGGIVLMIIGVWRVLGELA